MNVLVPEADTLGAIGVIRSLGKRGHTIHAVSRNKDALGFYSNFADSIGHSPEYNDPRFISWLRAQVLGRKIDVIIPSESFLLAIADYFEEFKSLIPFSQDKKKLYDGMSKYELFLKTYQENLPPYLTLDLESPLPITELKIKLLDLPRPHYIKVDSLFSKNGNSGMVYKTNSISETISKIFELKNDFKKLMVQGHVEGQGVGAFFLIWEGKVIADFMHQRLHEVPHTGGVSSYRKSFLHESIYEDAKRRVLDLGWKGPVMMEYRLDHATDKFYLMEMNGRFWGSLHLPIYAGVDFPGLLLDCFSGRPIVEAKAKSYRQNVYCRNSFPFDVQHTWSCIKSSDFTRFQKMTKILKFISLTLHPGVYSDLFSFAGDRKLFFRNLGKFLEGNFKRILRSEQEA